MSRDGTPATLAEVPELLADAGVFPREIARAFGEAMHAQLEGQKRQRAAEAALQGLLARAASVSSLDTVLAAVKLGDWLVNALAAGSCSICGIPLADHTKPGKCPQ